MKCLKWTSVSARWFSILRREWSLSVHLGFLSQDQKDVQAYWYSSLCFCIATKQVPVVEYLGDKFLRLFIAIRNALWNWKNTRKQRPGTRRYIFLYDLNGFAFTKTLLRLAVISKSTNVGEQTNWMNFIPLTRWPFNYNVSSRIVNKKVKDMWNHPVWIRHDNSIFVCKRSPEVCSQWVIPSSTSYKLLRFQYLFEMQSEITPVLIHLAVDFIEEEMHKRTQRFLA